MTTSAELRPFVFDVARGTWVEERAAQGAGDTPSALTVVTWNVWFAPYAFERRFEALLAVVRAQHPDVICLQEIIPESLALLLADPWIRSSYRISDASGATLDGYGVVILSRLPVRSLALHELPSHMGRRLLVAEIAVGPRSLVVGTVHLESLRPNRDVRADQLAEIFPRLKAAGPDCVLTGDFNFCSSWTAENANIDPEFVDLWAALHPRDPGYTEDTSVNAMLWNVKRKDKFVRYDRVLLRSAGGGLRPAAITRLGMTPVAEEAPDVFPSDHFGLAALIERVGSGGAR